MYEFEVPPSIKQNLSMYYRVYFWFRDDTQSTVHRCRKILVVLFYASFVVSIGVGGLMTADSDQSIFLSVMSVLGFLHNYRVWLILWNKTSILKCIEEIGVYHTKEKRKFDKISNDLKLFMKFCHVFTVVTNIGIFAVSLLYPILNRVNGKRGLFLGNAFVVDYSDSDVTYLAVNVFVNIALFQTAVVCTLVPTLWYLLLSLVFRYRLLNASLQTLGMRFAMKNSSGDDIQKQLTVHESQALFLKDLLMAIQDYNQINRYSKQNVSKISSRLFAVSSS